MPEPLSPNLSRAREQKISELSDHFANDDLTLEDLERRIERVYKAATIADLDVITADLRSAAPVVDPRAGSGRRERSPAPIREAQMQTGYEIPHSRLLAIMSSTRRTGRWAVPRDLTMFAMMSDTKLDLTQASLPVGGIVNIEITAMMASVKIVVPPGMRVINEMHSFMADVRSSGDDFDVDGLMSPQTPVIRLTGTAIMAEIKVKIRRREEPVYDDEE
jgi:hypothetical protein